MASFRVRVAQVFRVERVATVEVEADDMASAIESLESGEADLIAFDDPRWSAGWSLENEHVEAAQ